MHKNSEGEIIIKILIADDNKNLLQLIKNTILRQGGFDVLTCITGKETIEKASQEMPDIIILDYKLPDLNANEIVNALRGANINIPFMIMTGHGDEKVAVELMKLGAKDYLIKDVSFLEFLPVSLKRLAQEIKTEKELISAKKNLSETEDRYRHLFINANDIIYTMDLEGNFTTVNPIAEKLLGYSHDEIIGLNIASYATPESQKTALYNIHRQLVDKESHLNYEIEVITKDKRHLILEINSYLRFINDMPVEVYGIARDITERKRYQQRLEEQFNLVRSIFDSSPDALVICQFDGKIEDCNHHAINLFNFKEKADYKKVLFHELFCETEKEKLIQFWKQLNKYNQTSSIEIEYNNAENNTLILEISSGIMYDNDQKPLFIVSTIKDITVRKRNEEQLRKSEDKFRSIFENSGIGIFQANLKGVFFTVNNAFAVMLGYENAEKFLKTVPDVNSILHTAEQKAVEILKTIISSNGIVKYEQQLKRRDGIIISVNITARTVKNNGKIEYIEGFVEDVTDTRRAKNAMKESIAQLKDAQKLAKIASFEEDLVGKFYKFSDPYFEILGVISNIERCNFNHEKLLEIMHPEDRENYINFRQNIISKLTNYSSIQYRIIKHNKEIVYINSIMVLILNDRKEPIKIMGTIQDITEQKKHEELKRNLEIVEKTKLIQHQLLTNLGHEIRTPMNGILGMAEILQKSELNPKQSEIVSIIKDSSQNLMKLINNILDLIKIDTGHMQLMPSTFQLLNIKQTMSGLFKASLHEKNLSFTIDIDEQIPKFLIADKTRLIQILTNLISNAIKFTQEGSIQVNFKLKEFFHDKVLIYCEVIDTGIGIEIDNPNILFDKFVQLDATSTRKFEGAGLGLAISKELVELMGGKIGVSSTKGKGSCFWFTFLAAYTDQMPDII